MDIHKNIAYVLLGSNIGVRSFYIESAIAELLAVHKIIAVSKLYETEAWGQQDQQAYLNCAVALEVEASATDFFAQTRTIETALGRRDKGNYQPRTIDIDILFFGDEIIDTRSLTIPHPRLQLRRFVLVPMMDIAPDLEHPILKQSITQLLEACEDDLEVKVFEVA